MNERQIEEYTALRQEILARGRGVSQVILGSLVIVVPFISSIIIYFLKNANDIKTNPSILYPYIFLFPLLIILPCSFFIVALRKDIFRYSTYIEVFFEEQDKGPKWETALSKYRQVSCKESLDPTFWLYWALFCICAGGFYYSLNLLGKSNIHLISLILLAILLLRAQLLYINIPKKSRIKFYHNWLDVRKHLDKLLCFSLF